MLGIQPMPGSGGNGMKDFECSERYYCLTSLHVDPGPLFAFGHEVCEREDRAFSDEPTL